MNARGRWQGMLTIARLNWPFYAAVSLLLLAAIGGIIAFPAGWPVFALILAGGVYFLFGSLGVSHQIYDRSDLYRWQWLARALPETPPARIIFCHAGFDEASESLRARLEPAEWTVLDHFDAVRMTEASIRRARALFPPTVGTRPARFDQWPVASHQTALICGLLAIHELRGEPERTAWFAEAKRCLHLDGRVLLVEHVRDLANFLAFGPGCLHFHSEASWRHCWEAAGLRCHDAFRITPWVRVFVLFPL